MSDRLLSQRLRELEVEGLVERKVEPGAPVRVSYSLTIKGADLDPRCVSCASGSAAGRLKQESGPSADQWSFRKIAGETCRLPRRAPARGKTTHFPDATPDSPGCRASAG